MVPQRRACAFWFFAGAAVGAAVPLGMRLYERVFMWGYVRPIGEWLFWPTSLLLYVSESQSATTHAVLFFTAILSNAILYALVASVLRRGSLAVLAVLIITIWIALPPSERALVSRFSKHRSDLDRLVQLATEDSQLIWVGSSVLKTVDGHQYQSSGSQSVLSAARWAEYRRLLGTTGVHDGISRDPTTGDVFLSMHRSHRVDPAGADFGYVHCAAIPQRTSGSLPCIEDQEFSDKGGYRWKRLDDGWYLYEVRRQ